MCIYIYVNLLAHFLQIIYFFIRNIDSLEYLQYIHAIIILYGIFIK